MGLSPFKRMQPGETVSVADWNRLCDAVESLYRMSGTGDLTVDIDGVAPRIKDIRQPEIWIKITGAPSGKAYPWSEVYETTPGTWTVKPDGQTGTTTSIPAYPSSGSTTIPTNTVVKATLDETYGHYVFQDVAGAAATGLTVKETDPIVYGGSTVEFADGVQTGVLELQFNISHGFQAIPGTTGVIKITQPGANGQTSGSWTGTTSVRAGPLTLDDQYCGRGVKMFDKIGVVVTPGSQIYNDPVWVAKSVYGQGVFETRARDGSPTTLAVSSGAIIFGAAGPGMPTFGFASSGFQATTDGTGSGILFVSDFNGPGPQARLNSTWIVAGRQFDASTWGGGFMIGNFQGDGTITTPKTFTTADGKTVTVRCGLITSIS